jgi:hypothetical protein
MFHILYIEWLNLETSDHKQIFRMANVGVCAHVRLPAVGNTDGCISL